MIKKYGYVPLYATDASCGALSLHIGEHLSIMGMGAQFLWWNPNHQKITGDFFFQSYFGCDKNSASMASG